MQSFTNDGFDKVTLSERVYQVLVDKIISGVIEPESRLREEHVAKEYNVSATPVREAFKRLASEGFIELIPYQGAIVHGINDEEITDVYRCRLALENLALELAIDKFDDVTLQKIEDLINYSKITTNIFDIATINRRFHNIIYNVANNRTLYKLIESLDNVLARDMKFSASDTVRRNNIIIEHSKILSALKNKDLKSAQEAMKEHIMNGKAYIEAKRKHYMP